MNPSMQRAIELSREGMRQGFGGPFGAVVVRDGKIIGEGFNQVLRNNDPSAHGEVMAIRDACKRLGQFWLEGCEIYTSAEPCPMCLGAIYWARIAKVYYANSVGDADEVGADDLKFYDELAKPPEQRKVPMVRIDAPEALEVFKEWAANPKRTVY